MRWCASPGVTRAVESVNAVFSKSLKPHIPEYFAEDMEYSAGTGSILRGPAPQLRISRRT